MILPDDGACTVSAASRNCLSAIPRTVLTSSEDAGWTSVLIERHLIRPDGDVLTTVATPDQTVVVMTRGEQEIELLGRSSSRVARYAPGTGGLTGGGEVDRIRRRRRPGHPTFEKINLYLPARTVAEAVEHFRRPGQRSPRARLRTLARHDEVVLHTARAMAAAAAAGAPELYASTSAQWLTVHLLAADPAWAERVARDASAHRSPRLRLADVLDLMHGAYAQPLTLDQLASAARVSKYHFSRAFRAATGLSPHRYLVRLRVEAAKDLLTSTDLTIREVSGRCGFVQQSHFAATFATQCGMSPSQYRRGHGVAPPGA